MTAAHTPDELIAFLRTGASFSWDVNWGRAGALNAAADLIERLLPIVRRTAEHFDGTDAPLGTDARAALTAAGVAP
jgi:hypothetical protein